MPSLKLYDMNAKEVGAIELSDLFDMEYNEPAAKSAGAARSPGDRREPAGRDRVPSGAPSG